MTGLEFLLWIYLGGAVGTSVYGYTTCHDSSRVTNGECAVIAVGSGVVWPVVVGAAVAEDLR